MPAPLSMLDTADVRRDMTVATALKRFGLSDRLVRRTPLYYGTATRLLRTFDTREEPGNHRWIEERLENMLAAARRTPYGRAIGAPGALTEWPILEKESVRLDPAKFLQGTARFSTAASTSGTTGTPLQLRRSLASVAYEQAVIDRCVSSVGVDPTRCRAAVLRGDDIKSTADRAPPYWRLANGGQRLLFSSNHLNADTVGHFVGALREYAPEVIFAYPTVLDSLCALMADRGDRLEVPVAVCSSEMMTRATAERAAAVLGTRVLDYYGQAERVAFASGNPLEGYRFLPSYSVNELLPKSADAEGSVHEIIGTGLWNEAMPLVRYRTGDYVRLAPGADAQAVARGAQTFLGIIGREDEVLAGPAGARLTGIDHIPRGVPGVIRAQFIQESLQHVRLLVITDSQFDEHARRLLLEHAALKLPPGMQVSIEPTNELIRNRSGKAPLVIRHV